MSRSHLPGFLDFLRWRWERIRSPLPAPPAPHEIPRATPDPARPRAPSGEVRVTWVGHATFVIQIGGLNVLTDPVFGKRVSPVKWMGPPRLAPLPMTVDELPPVDVVLLSHDHFDHLDRPTVLALRARFGDGPVWITPRGYRGWFARIGIENVHELDWWDEVEISRVSVQALPAQHWSRRGLRVNARHWASYGLRARAPERSLYFGGDSGYFDGYRTIRERSGPFEVHLLPIGAYEPRWFMKHAHMNPEDVVQAYRDLGGEGAVVGMHWGTFRLTDEHVLEPPARMRVAWRSAELPEGDLHLPGVGGTIVF